MANSPLPEIEVYRRKDCIYDFVQGTILSRVIWDKGSVSTSVTIEDPNGTWFIPEVTPYCVTTATYNNGARVVHIAVVRDQAGFAYNLVAAGERYTATSFAGDLTGAEGPVVQKISDVWKDSEVAQGMKWRVSTPFLPAPPLASLFLGLWLLPKWFPIQVAPGVLF